MIYQNNSLPTILNMKLIIKIKNVYVLSLVVISLPIFIFFITWLKIYIGIIATVVLFFGLKSIYKEFNDDEAMELPLLAVIISFVLIGLWIAYSGIGGYFFQTGDNHWRNAILRDLITFSWPVKYSDNDTALVYYLMYWLIPAAIGKVAGWQIANFALYLYTFIVVFIIFLQIAKYLDVQRSWELIAIAIILVFWSGENFIGLVTSNLLGICIHPIGFGSSEGWLDYIRNGYDCSYLYRSNIDALCQVYNQTVIPWLIVTLVLNVPKVRVMGFLGLCAVCYGPIPFIGLLPILFVLCLMEIKREHYQILSIPFLKQLVSIPNMCAVMTILPIMWLFYKSNIAFSESNQGSYITGFVPLEAYDLARWGTLLLFWILEFGLYSIILWNKNKKNPLYWCVIMTLIIVPFFKIGTIRDFCMNASLPCLFILMILVMDFIIKEYKVKEGMTRWEVMRYDFLVFLLILSMTTLIFDGVSKVYYMQANHVFPYIADDIVTLNGKDVDENKNFLVPDWESSAFFKYLAK